MQPTTHTQIAAPSAIDDALTQKLNAYIQSCAEQKVTGVYEMVLSTMEKPLLSFALRHCEDNQSSTAKFLGLNRNTLRKKLLAHKLIAS